MSNWEENMEQNRMRDKIVSLQRIYSVNKSHRSHC